MYLKKIRFNIVLLIFIFILYFFEWWCLIGGFRSGVRGGWSWNYRRYFYRLCKCGVLYSIELDIFGKYNWFFIICFFVLIWLFSVDFWLFMNLLIGIVVLCWRCLNMKFFFWFFLNDVFGLKFYFYEFYLRG